MNEFLLSTPQGECFCNLSLCRLMQPACLPARRRGSSWVSMSHGNCWGSWPPPWAFPGLAELTVNLESLPGRFFTDSWYYSFSLRGAGEEGGSMHLRTAVLHLPLARGSSDTVSFGSGSVRSLGLLSRSRIRRTAATACIPYSGRQAWGSAAACLTKNQTCPGKVILVWMYHNLLLSPLKWDFVLIQQ